MHIIFYANKIGRSHFVSFLPEITLRDRLPVAALHFLILKLTVL